MALLLSGRGLGGLAAGLVFSLCPLYAAEVSAAGIRGRVGGLYNVGINFSYAITEWMGLGLAYVKGGEVKFRIFLGLQILVAAVMLVGSWWMVESPRWLIVNGRHEEALDVLRRLHGDQDTHRSGTGEALAGEEDTGERSGYAAVPLFRREFNQIEAQIKLEREQEEQTVGLRIIVSKPSYRRRLFIILFFFVGQQLTGIM